MMAPMNSSVAQETRPPLHETETELHSGYPAAWEALRAAYLVMVDRVEAQFAAADLPGLAWFDVLEALEQSDQPVRPRELLCRVSVTKSGLTRLLDRIEREGLVERGSCPSDRRGTFLTVTDSGRRTLALMRPIRDREFAAHFELPLSEREAAVVAASLSRVAASAQAAMAAAGDCEI